MPPKEERRRSPMGDVVRKMMADIQQEEDEEEEGHREAAAEPVVNKEETIEDIFRKHKKPSLDVFTSYTELPGQRKRRKAFDAGSDGPSFTSLDMKKDKQSPRKWRRGAIASGSSMITPVTSLHILSKVRSGMSGSDHARRYRLEDGRQVYAGITHSDLDIQYNRPPLVHLVSILEWLFLHSTNSHRGIIMILAFLFMLVVLHISFAFLYFKQHWTEAVDNPYVCRTKECIELARRINQTLSPEKYKPCDDFYHFVCGNINPKQLEKLEKEQTWDHGFYNGKVQYDFFESEALGQMLKRTKKFPDSLLLPFYKGCLNEVERNKSGLQPFYDLLKALKLYDIQKDYPLTASNVIESMALILSHSLRKSAIIKDQTVRESDGAIRIHLLPSEDQLVSTGTVVSNGFLNYKKKVVQAFQLLNELNVHSNELELDMIANDITCLELFFNDGLDFNDTNKISDIFSGEPGVQNIICELGITYQGTPVANFGQQLNGDFDYEKLVRKIYEIMNPTWNSAGPLPIKENFRIDIETEHGFLKKFELVFRQSSPIRIMRYLQWRVFYELGFDLTTDMMKFMNEVQRFRTYGTVQHCIENLFYWLQFISPQMYLREKNAKEQTEDEDGFDQLMQNIRTSYERVVATNKFKEFQNVTRSYNDEELSLLRHIIGFSMRSIVVPPLRFNEKNFARYPELYEGMEFNENDHLGNLMKVGRRVCAWRFDSHFHDAFYSIKSIYTARVGITLGVTRHETRTHHHIMYLPLASAEIPFFKEGLRLSDIGGAGLVYAEYLESSLRNTLDGSEHRKDLIESLKRDEHLSMFTESQMTNIINDFDDKYIKQCLKKKFEELYSSKQWDVAGGLWHNFTSDIALSRSIDTLIADQSRYHIISLFAENFLHEPYVSSKIKKMRLPGLEKYNIMQIFYISIVNRRCHKMSSHKQNHMVLHGPISHDFRNNWALRNLDNFAKTFNCPSGSPMNPTDKIYFWDRDLKVDDFSAKDSLHDFYAEDDHHHEDEVEDERS